MTDSNLVRVLSRQTGMPVGLIPLDVVRRGAEAIHHTQRSSDDRYLLVDATNGADLLEVARACVADPLVAGAAGLAGALSAVLSDGLETSGLDETSDLVGDVPTAVLAGSCSARTLEQIDALIAAGRPALRIDPRDSQEPRVLAAQGLRWFDSLNSDDAVVAALGVTGGVTGHEEAPGVPWIHTTGGEPLALLLKSGNFGRPAFLLDASR
jgi:uncharacterized protein YgbK (DUF1537 family)